MEKKDDINQTCSVFDDDLMQIVLLEDREKNFRNRVVLHTEAYSGGVNYLLPPPRLKILNTSFLFKV